MHVITLIRTSFSLSKCKMRKKRKERQGYCHVKVYLGLLFCFLCPLQGDAGVSESQDFLTAGWVYKPLPALNT